ncbi:MAG: type III pantothenate kinase [Phycisphaerae bacterium]|nr:type III pantothenate kinase [Phycisphaerae bacterium]
MPHQADPRIHASLVILEIGNSHVSVASCIKGQIRTHQRFSHEQIDEVVEHAGHVWAAVPDNLRRAVVAASVVPSMLGRLRGHITKGLDTLPLVVGEDLHRPISLAVESPEAVGIDRICCAAAAYDRVRKACVIASFGTAVTVDCVNNEGVFMGGAILPGLGLQASALHEKTAQLPHVTVEPTGAVYGTSTEQAIRNGIIYGVVGGLREITERYATELREWPQLIVTGGNAELISEHCDFIDNVVPDLCVRGIALAYRKHFAPFEDE